MSDTPPLGKWDTMTIDQKREWVERTRERESQPKASESQAAPVRQKDRTVDSTIRLVAIVSFIFAIASIASGIALACEISSESAARVILSVIIAPLFAATVWAVRGIVLSALEFFAANTPQA